MSILSALRLAPHRVTFNWNGEIIDFSRWPADAFGRYTYTTRDRSASFSFELKPVGGVVRIYILDQPSYRGRPSDGHATHRIDIGARPFVCIRSDYQPTNVPDALSWAVYWAEETARYIRTGRAFS